MIQQFFALISKNLKNLFRNWTSIFLLIIGPLILITVLIVAFSDMGFHNITIGYVGDQEVISSIIDQIDNLGNFKQFQSIDVCKSELKKQKVHLCIDVKDEETTNIQLNFDNTREVISLILISQIREGITREKDTVLRSKTNSLMDNLRDTQVYISDKQKGISQIIYTLKDYIIEIEDTQTEMLRTRNEIDLHITNLQNLKHDLEDVKKGVDAGASEFYKDTNSIYTTEQDLIQTRNNLRQLNQDTTAIDQAIASISMLQSTLIDIQGTISDTQNELNTAIWQIEQAISSLKRAKTFLYETDLKLTKIKNSLSAKIIELNNINGELNSKQNQLSSTTSMNIDTLVNPFVLQMEPLFQGSERIQMLASSGITLSKETAQELISISSVQTLLPFLLSILICFIAVIISNIIILDEKNSPAYTRNLITPIPRILDILSILLTILSVLLIIVGVILMVGYFVFFLDLSQSIGTIILVSTLLTLIYSLWGMSLGYLIRSTTTSLLIAAFFLILNIFLSGTIFPVERMSRIILSISSVIPFRDGLSILQQSMFYNIEMVYFYPKIIKLLIILFVSILVLIASYKISQARFKQGI